MVGRRRPPPPAPPAMPPSSRAKDYKTDRPSEVQDELDMVRSRGMAKILNRHFTDTTKKLSQEKAEADAALADLERRRAQTSDFVPSQGGGLNPYDSMYVELQHKREACRRKEKETMLLYQRYVHKYGKKGKVEPPKPEEVSQDNSTTTASEAVPPPSPLPGKRTPLQPLDEISESLSVVSNDVKFSKFYNKQLAERNKGDAPPDPPGDPPGAKTSELAADVKEEQVTKKVSMEAEVPYLEALTPQTSKDTDITNPPDRAEDTGVSEQELSAPKPDAPEVENRDSPTNVHNASEGPAEESQDSTPKAQNASDVLVADPPSVKVDRPKQEDPKREDPKPDPVKDSKETRESDSDDSENRPTKEVTTEMPSAADTSDDEETDIRSMISGLTSVNSVSARQVMDEIVNEMDIFIKTETEEIRKMLEVEEEKTVASTCDESVRVTLQAEAMAQEMKNTLVEFKKDEASVAAASLSQHDADKSNASSSGYPRKFDTPNPKEEWKVYYDETFQREYYHETHRNCTQWEPPTSKPKLHLEQQDFSDDMMSETLSPRGTPRRQSRRSLYRKRMRKSRVRRFVAFLFLLSCVAFSCWHWQTNHPDKSYPEAMEATFRNFDWESSATYIKDKATYIKDKATYIKDNFEYTLTDRKAMEASKRLDSELQEAKRAKMEAEQKAKEETERKAAEERRRQEKIAAELNAKEEAHRKEMELKEKQAKKKAEEEASRKELEREEAEQLAIEESKALQRPWGCYLPLSYLVHRRCRRLARSNPMYNEDDLLDSFLL